MKNLKFESDIYLNGNWKKIAHTTQLEDIAYYLYLVNVDKKLKDGSWLKLESTLVLDQVYFLTSGTGEFYTKKARNYLRTEKLKKIRK